SPKREFGRQGGLRIPPVGRCGLLGGPWDHSAPRLSPTSRWSSLFPGRDRATGPSRLKGWTAPAVRPESGACFPSRHEPETLHRRVPDFLSSRIRGPDAGRVGTSRVIEL